MPGIQNYITRTGAAAALAVEATLVATYTVTANRVLSLTDLIVASDAVASTYWIATAAGFIHAGQVYLAAAGFAAVTFGTPFKFAPGTLVTIRALSVGATYTEATWNGVEVG